MPSPPPSKAPPPSPPPPAPSPPHPPNTTTTTTTTSSSSSPSDEANPRFPPAEEASLLTESNQLKASANTTFTRGDFSTAISEYDKALASCPNYLDYEIAVLKSNIAACHLKLEDWKAAVEAADAALEGIARLLNSPPPPPPVAAAARASSKKKKKKKQDTDDTTKHTTTTTGVRQPGRAVDDDDDEEEEEEEKHEVSSDRDASAAAAAAAAAVVVELPDHLDETAALAQLQRSDARHGAIARIRAKSLMRRARARSQLAGWANLQAAQEDYSTLSSMQGPDDVLPPQDRKVVQAALRELPARVARAREAEMGEMMGKLKDLGNSVLKPFGLSTDMFKMQKDEKTGGYSMSMNQEN